jgi:hypothetical protein
MKKKSGVKRKVTRRVAPKKRTTTRKVKRTTRTSKKPTGRKPSQGNKEAKVRKLIRLAKKR